MYMHMIDNETRTIVSTNDVLKIMDDKYDSLKKYYPVFAIENFLVRIFYPSIFVTILNLFHIFVAYPSHEYVFIEYTTSDFFSSLLIPKLQNNRLNPL